MFSVRPAESPHHLARPRLLDALPDQKGFVVWLEAPYGYGKSILASQWAWQLEDRGWRVVWLSLAEREPRTAIAQQLNLPPTAPWGALLDELWSVPTLLVLEELQGDEDLQPLLKAVGGLLLLASRQHLPYPPLAQLATTGRLIHLTASQLAFTEDEASQLFSGSERAGQAWESTNGWPLPLHFASLSEVFPTSATLLEGVRLSVSQQAWSELLFMAALDQLPGSAASEATLELARAGFVQQLGSGYRLHPLVAEGAIERFRTAVREQLDASGQRLPPALRGAAFERAGSLVALAQLLTTPGLNLQSTAPHEYLRWHELAPEKDSPRRLAYCAEALLLLNRYGEALPNAKRLVTGEQLTLAERATLASVAVFTLAGAKRFEQCDWFADQLRGLMHKGNPLIIGRAHQNLAYRSYMQADYEEAENLYRRALAAYAELEPGPERTHVETRARSSLYLISWETHGAIEESLSGLLQVLDRSELDENTAVLVRQNAAVNLAYLWEIDRATRLCREAAAHAAPYHRLMIDAMLAFFELDVGRFPGLLAAARRWEQNELSERVSALWLRTLRFMNDTRSAAGIASTLQTGPYTKLELAWVTEAEGDHDRALKLLEDARGGYPYREFRLHWHAADFMLNRKEAALDQLLSLVSLSSGRERLLRYVGMPLEHLPRHRPELARFYPLDQVLASGWHEAIEQRKGEIPPLQVHVHGEVSATVMGREVALSERQQQLLALLAIGRSREQIGDSMWPDIDAARQRNNMGVQLNVLRKALEPWGVATYLQKDGLQNFTSDHKVLMQALDEGNATTVLSTYRQPLFGGLDLEELTDAAHELHERTISLLFTSASAKDDEGSLDLLRRLLELEPLHEEAVQLMLTRLAARGRGREARRTYERFAALLEVELGLTPQPATTALVPSP